MTDRPKFFDDLAGVAGGAMSALAGLREEAEGTMRARAEEMIRKLDLVRREDLEAVQEMAANARAAQAAMELRVAALERKLAAQADAPHPETAHSDEAQPGPSRSSAVSQATAAAHASSPVQPPAPPSQRGGDDIAEGSPS